LISSSCRMQSIREHLEKSLTALKANKLELFYLHAPDRSTPFEVTFKAVDDLHKEGKFNKVC
jgi:aflatoxin B1 aldehyde reductase